jgi:O-antigen ligase
MRDVMVRYGVAAHVCGLAAFLAWVYGGARLELLAAVPWLSLGVLEMTLLFPAPRKGETQACARQRVKHAMVRDPLLYMALFFFSYLLFQWLNGGRALVLDAAQGVWSLAMAPLSWGPSCVDRTDVRQALCGVLPAVAVVLGIRHGVTRRGKLVLLRVLVANGALLGLAGVGLGLCGAERVLGLLPTTEPFFAAFPYTNHAGAFFVLLAAIALGLFVQAWLAGTDRRLTIWLGVALAGNLAGAIGALSRASILLALLLVVLGGCYAIRHAWHLVCADVRFKAIMGLLLILLAGGAFWVLAPRDNPVVRELRAIPWDTIGQETWGARAPQVAFAWQLWREHPWFGVGCGGFRHYAALQVEGAVRATWHRGGGQVHNDGVQMLAEQGVVGGGLWLAAVAVLVTPVIRRLRIAHVTPVEEWSGGPWLLFRVSPITVMLLAGVVLTCLTSLIDLPFRSPAILVTWCIALACAPAFLPAKARLLPSASLPMVAGVRKPVAPTAVSARGR